MLQRHLHRADRPFAIRRRRGHVMRIGGEPVAGELAVDLRAARFRMLELLDDDNARAFAHDEAVAIAIPRP